MTLNNEPLSYQEFDSAPQLIDYFKTGNEADIVFLDIFMQGMNGIDAAEQLRNLGYDFNLVLISSSSEFAPDSYHVRASSYIVKPVSFEALSDALVSCLYKSELVPQPLTENTLTFVANHKEMSIPQAAIQYIEIYNRILLIHCADGTQYNPYGTIEGLYNELNQKLFIRPNRSYIINMNYIDQMRPRECALKNQQAVSISRLNNHAVHEAYRLFLQHQLWET